MRVETYVVKLGGKLYVQSEFYSFYPATTKDMLNAKFFTDYAKACKIAKKAHGEVVRLYISDEENEEIEAVKNQRDMAAAETKRLKAAFSEIFKKNSKRGDNEK